MRALRYGLIGLGAILALAVAGLALFLATFDANALKPRLVEAVQRATGHDLALRGEIRLRPALRPTLAVADVGFANAGWGSRPEMARLASLEVSLAVLPLLRGEIAIDRIVLIEPDILLETDSEGRGNWELRPAAEAPTPPAPSERRERREPPRIAVESLRIDGGKVAFRDGRSGRLTTLAIPSLEASIPSGEPIRLDLAAVLDGTEIRILGTTGPLERLLSPSGPPFPVDLSVSVGEARVTARGTLAEPLAGRGFDLALTVRVPDLARLAAAMPGVPPLPPLRGLELAVSARDTGAIVPDLRSLSLAIAESDLAELLPGLRLRALRVSAQDATSPLDAAGEALLNGLPVSLAASLGPLGDILPGADPSRPWPVSAELKAAGASLTVRGTVSGAATPRPAVRAAVQATVPDLSALSPLLGRPLPAMKDASLQATITGPDRARRIAIGDLAVALAGSDLAGAVTIGIEGRPSIEGELRSRRIDADALLASAAAASAPAAPPPPPSERPAAPRTRLIPDEPLPLEVLQVADASVRLALSEVRYGGVAYRDVNGSIRLNNGALVLEPLDAVLPGGPVSIRLGLEAARREPSVRLALAAPSLDLRQLAAAFGGGYRVGGTLELDLDVRGRGASPHRIASTLDGHLGVAGANLDIDNRLIDLIAGEVWRALVPGAPRDGVANVRCLALRLDARGGTAEARALLFDSNLARVSGTGSLALGAETLALRLSPTLKIAGGGLGVPVTVGGTFLNPTVRVDPAGAIGALGRMGTGAAAGATAGSVAGPLGAIVGGVAGAARVAALPAGEDCATQLTIARGGRQGAMPPPEAQPAAGTPAEAVDASPTQGTAAPAPQQQPQQQRQDRLPAPLQQLLPGLRR